MMKRFLISAVICFALLCKVKSQNSNPYDALPKILPPTPEAAAMQQHGGTDVNLFKGEPNISIPIYQLSGKRISVPVVLNYNASGFRVGELSTNVGLGWSLSAGGMISRNVRGQSDFKATRRETVDIFHFEPNYGISEADHEQAKRIVEQNLDIEPDLFYYSFPGRSGKFVLNDSLNRAYTIPFEKLKIDMLGFDNTSTSTDDSAFVLTDEAGIRYFFTLREVNNPSEHCTIGTANNREIKGNNLTGWYLTKIVDPLKDSIVFEYEQYNYSYREGKSEVRYKYLPSSQCASYAGEFSNQERLCTRTVTIYTNRIKRIISMSGEVEFFYNTRREDIDYYSTNADAKRLDSIIIRNKTKDLKKFVFLYDYFISNGKSSAAAVDTFLYKRLKLTALQEQGAAGTDVKEYKFNYNETRLLPHRLHNGQDYFGFHNGLSQGSGIVPCGYGFNNCVNREIDQTGTYQQANVMKEIIYPTGGKTKFFFEPHRRTYYATTHDTTFGAFAMEVYPEEIKTDSITLPASSSRYLRLTWSLPYSSDALEGFSTGFVTLPDGSRLQLDSIGTSGSIIIDRMEGKYKFRVSSFRQYVADASIVMNWVDTVISTTNKVNEIHSGLRVKKVVDSAGFGSPEVTRFFKYESPVDSLEKFSDFRGYSFFETVQKRFCQDMMLRHCSYAKLSSQSVSPFGVENDNIFGYKYVTILFDSAGTGKGKEEYMFTTGEGEIDSLGFTSDLEHLGKLLVKKQFRYDQATQTYALVQEEKNRYTFLVDENDFLGINNPPRFAHLNENFITGAKIQYKYPAVTCDLIVLVPEFITDGYTRNSFWQYPNSSEVIMYPVNGALIKKTEKYIYNNPAHLQLTATETVSSNRDTIRTFVKYVNDYTLPSTGDAIVNGMKNLADKHIITIPVESLKILKKSTGEEYILSGTITSFKANAPIPDKIFMIEAATPIPKGSFVFSDIDQSGAFIKDPHYKEQAIFHQYDATGNILQQQRASDNVHSYLWDYNLAYPTVECIGAGNSLIAQTSFESNGKGNWNFTGTASAESTAPTGRMAYNLGQANGSITNMNPFDNETSYTVTWWLKDGSGTVSVNGSVGTVKTSRNGWTLYEASFETGTLGVTVSGTGTIDELRLHPGNAQMTTYTYDPLVGITSQCDLNNRISYYEYDSLQRLKLIRDQDGNILKTFEYKYQQQQ